MFKRQNVLKSLFSFFLILEFFVVSILPASAGMFGGGGGISIPSPSQVAAELESRYHMNLGSIQNQGESFNVSGDKNPTPEVSLFFSPSDPKPGQKLSAKAFPIYFSNTEEALYYSWYLKRKDCNSSTCDYNNDGRYNEEDWKIEAARVLVQNGYDNSNTDYTTGSDDDGYRARFGGDNKTNVPNYCYVHDPGSGTNYEVADSGRAINFGCGSRTPVCMVNGSDTVTPLTSTLSEWSGGTITPFSVTTNTTYAAVGSPTCNGTSVSCGTGAACCVSDATTATTCEVPISACSATVSGNAINMCEHLFAQPDLGETGDGDFGRAEEEFWGTNPNDPSTADNGKKDEANVVGLGQSTFTWNYVAGDQVGVAVEGTSMIPTKHDDSSFMIMWAFPKNQCYPSLVNASTSAYVQSIKGYTVTIPTANMDLNDCIERNLIDPTQGGQATNLEVSVTATPDNPINDETSDKGGDIVVAQASVSNAQHGLTDMFFDWTVEISSDVNFNNRRDITSSLRAAGLLGNTRGNALDSVRVKLDMPSSITSGYLSGGIGYLRFRSTVTENFSSNSIRKGKSDVIVKFTSTTKKISAYKAGTELVSGTRLATLGGAIGICNNGVGSDALDRVACRVIKNEIIGLRIDDAGLSNFYWTVNGRALSCSKKVSNDCSNTEQGNVNFFPVVGNPGDTYTVTVTANDVNTGNALILSRTFGVVTPIVTIESLDKNIAWPRLLGQYKDISGNTTACPGGLCNDYSASMFEAFSGSTLGFRAVFIPSFLGSSAVRVWSVDGVVTAENAPREISFAADKPVGGIYNIGLTAQVKQSDETRRALLDIWGISPFESPEINFSTASQVQLQEPGMVEGPLIGPRKYLAAIVSYIPASVMFTFRIFLSAVLILFAVSFLYTLLEDRRAKVFEAERE